MNKDKHIALIDKEIQEVLYGKSYSLNTDEYRVGLSRGLKIVKEFIQSEPEEICNGCSYERYAGEDYPCKKCKRNWEDRYQKAGE